MQYEICEYEVDWSLLSLVVEYLWEYSFNVFI